MRVDQCLVGCAVPRQIRADQTRRLGDAPPSGRVVRELLEALLPQQRASQRAQRRARCVRIERPLQSPEQFRQCRRRARPRQRIALAEIRAQQQRGLHQAGGFQSLDHHLDAQCLPQQGELADEAQRAQRIGGHAAHQGLVDLDAIERPLPQTRQRAVAGAEIVLGHAHAQRLECQHARHAATQRVLGLAGVLENLQQQRTRRTSAGAERGGGGGDVTRVIQRRWRQVDGDIQRMAAHDQGGTLCQRLAQAFAEQVQQILRVQHRQKTPG